jgi:hypothetical protein
MRLAIDIQELPGGVVRASCLTLPGCVGYGLTLEEACSHLREIAARFFDDLRGVPPAFFGTVPAVRWN